MWQVGAIKSATQRIFLGGVLAHLGIYKFERITQLYVVAAFSRLINTWLPRVLD
jgi:hypothetical protein